MSKTHDALVALIESQQKGKENTDVFMVGEQLKDIGSESEHNAEILLQDLQIKTMDLVAGAAKLKDYADKNRIRYVDYHSVMKDAENGLPEKWSYDGVHLNGDGYDIIEGIILKELK